MPDTSPTHARRGLGRDFRAVWAAVLISSTGDGMFITAFPLLAARLTTDPVLIAGVTIAQRLPWLLVSLFSGAIADRMDRRRLMIGADVVRGVVVAAFGIGVVVHVVDIWTLYGCAFLLTVGETLHVSAGQAVLPALVEPRDLLQANSRFGIAQISSAQFLALLPSTSPPPRPSLPTRSRSLVRRRSSRRCLTCMPSRNPRHEFVTT
jgi:MFS family permease